MYFVLIEKMARNNISYEMLAELLHIHRNSVANETKGKSKFTIGQAIAIRDKYFPNEELEHLFETEEVAMKADAIILDKQ